MTSSLQTEITRKLITNAKSAGASLAGVTSVASLRNSPYYKSHEKFELPEEAKSILVLALVHEASDPKLDWWSDQKGGTPGNLRLINTLENLRQWLNEKYDVKTRALSYHIERGGIPLKDAAVLAGLGIIGRNNLLITPEFGPHVRLKAMCLDTVLDSAEPLDFNPCGTCEMPCVKACAQEAFAPGSFTRESCRIQMSKDEASKTKSQSAIDGSLIEVVKYCRACELSCTAAK
ncbi:MAG: hypothetical protein JRG97_04425 [Deltaproteobacteria bacterium]|nr:hypothetical protein [Deltaproteobacteria bacterium]MBW2322905.1 hypothetical protein [Deltaproteobacteria bacterium]